MGAPRAQDGEAAWPMGVRAAAVRLLGRLRIYRRLVIMETPIHGTPATRPPSLSLDARAGGPGDLDDYFTLRPDADRADVMARLARGERWFGAWHDGQLLSTIWAATGSVRLAYLERDLPLAPGEASAYDSFTAEAYRGREIATVRSTVMERALVATGTRRLLIAILPENRFQQRRGLKRNRRPVAVVGYVGIGRWRRHFVRPVRGPESAAGAPALGPERRGARGRAEGQAGPG